jgi:hypothetical protein
MVGKCCFDRSFCQNRPQGSNPGVSFGNSLRNTFPVALGGESAQAIAQSGSALI